MFFDASQLNRFFLQTVSARSVGGVSRHLRLLEVSIQASIKATATERSMSTAAVLHLDKFCLEVSSMVAQLAPLDEHFGALELVQVHVRKDNCSERLLGH